MMNRRSDGEGSPSRRWFLRQIGLLAGASVVGERSAARAVSLIQNPPLSDEQICRRKFDIAIRESLSARPIGEVMVAIGSSFLATPYQPKTLETSGSERLVVNLRALDCVTFVENTLALSRCVKLGRTTFDAYREQLRLIRYRGGVIDGYASRLHYFSDWIADNEEKGILSDVTREVGGEPLTRPIHFMSSHPESYSQLEDEAVLEEIRRTEQRLNARNRYFVSTRQLNENPSILMPGDILGITTKIEGLDIAHTGMVAITNGQVRYLHAPLSGGSVQLSERSLPEYLEEYKNHTGVMVARPVEPA